MRILDFKDIHKGETILLVGNGRNLLKTPPENFDYPSIGMNTICEYKGDWKPDYYVAVDTRLWYEFGASIQANLKGIPKFISQPRLTVIWGNDNVVGLKHPPGVLWPDNRLSLFNPDLTKPVVYGNVMHVAMKLAYWMGAKTILIIGMEHEPHAGNEHFWGTDEKMNVDPPSRDWQKGYKLLAEEFSKNKVKLFNISKDTFVDPEIIPCDKWHKYATKKE